jgi:hypothetical protein
MNCTPLRRKYPLIVLMIAIGIQLANGQDLSEYITREEPSPASSAYETFKGLQVSNAQSTTLLGDKELMMFIGHRFGKVSGGFYELFGLDVATMRLGLDYAFLPWLTAGIGRSTYEKTWDIRIKGRLLHQAKPGIPLNLVLYGQAGYNTVRDVFPESQDNIAGRMTYSFQALASRDIKRFSFQLVPIYLYSAYDPILSGSADMISLGMASRVALTKTLDLTMEYYAALVKPDPVIKNPLTLGIEIDTGGHLFQLIVGNAQGMIDKAVLLNTTGTWQNGDIYFGFNLVRVYYL